MLFRSGPSLRASDFEPIFEASKALKDPVKMAANVAEKREEWLNKLALSAVTGEVLAWGLWLPDNEEHEEPMVCMAGSTGFEENAERALLLALWGALDQPEYRINHKLCGWNICGFDLPFLQRRSWVHGVEPPAWVYHATGRGLAHIHTDLMLMWSGFNPTDRISLATAAKLFRLPGKLGNGADFAATLATDRDAAEAYLRQDIILTSMVAERMGVEV